MMITAGIDIGSISTKAAVMTEGKRLGTRLIFTGYNQELAGWTVFEESPGEMGLQRSAVAKILSTGDGWNSVKFVDRTMSEIICHGDGGL
jgi:activator of 2-hydroxyglutaryl-CoA dehydratase